MSDAARKRTVEVPIEPEEAQQQPTAPGPIDIRNVSLSVIATLAVVVMLQQMQPVLIPIALGILISYALWPIVNGLARIKVPRAIGAAVAIAVFVGTLGFAFYTFSDEAMGIIRGVPPAARSLREYIDAKRKKTTAETPFEEVQKAATEIDRATAKAAETSVETKGVQKVEIVQPSIRVSDYVSMGGGIFGLGGQFVVILFLVYFLLVTGDLFKRKLVKIAGPTLTKKKITVQILDDINRQIERFIKVQIFTSALVAAATAAALWWFEVEHFILWGILAGILNSIPYIGPIVVSGGLAVVTFMQFYDIWKAVWVAGTAMVITSLEGFLLTPALMSKAAQMNPAAIFIGLLFWSWVWGIWGTVLAMPILMMVKSICDHVEDLQPIGELLGE